MTGALAVAVGTLMLAIWAAPGVAGVDADVARTVTMVYAGDPGAAGGDVNADGRASAADLTGVLIGLRSPTQPGPFTAGVRKIQFIKKSVTHPDQDRVLLTDVWYPTEPDAGTVSRTLGGVVDAPLAAGQSNLPLLMFSHGSCGSPEQSLFLTPLLASYGFVVAAPPHPGNTMRELLTCGTTAAQLDSFQNREADIVFVINSLLQLNADSASFLYGAIDPQRIGMSGHSFGGQTTLRVCADDARIVAGLALAPALFAVETQAARIDIPMMIESGTADTVLPFSSNALPAYNLLHPPRYLLAIDRTGHYAFSDQCFPSSDCGPGRLTQEEAHLYVLRYSVPYLLHWVADDTRFDAFLAPESMPPGATLTSDL